MENNVQFNVHFQTNFNADKTIDKREEDSSVLQFE